MTPHQYFFMYGAVILQRPESFSLQNSVYGKSFLELLFDPKPWIMVAYLDFQSKSSKPFNKVHLFLSSLVLVLPDFFLPAFFLLHKRWDFSANLNLVARWFLLIARSTLCN